MSGAAATAEPTGGDPAPDAAETESVARRLGWRPKEEFRGPDGKWVSADEFLAVARERPTVFFNRMSVIDRKFGDLEGKFSATNQRLEEAQRTIVDMSEMVRRGEERGYKKAKADILAERDAAIETGDKAKVHQADAALADLDKTKPPEPRQPQAQQPAPQPPAPQVQPEVMAFYQQNPWYTTDPEMRAEADAIHVGLIQTRKDLTLEQNLKLVHDRMRKLFPEKFAPPPRANGNADLEPEPGDNPRRGEPPAVAPSGDAGGRQPRVRGRTFDAMPKESKDAYTRYARMLEGKGKPLTKEEWAADYFAQFEEA